MEKYYLIKINKYGQYKYTVELYDKGALVETNAFKDIIMLALYEEQVKSKGYKHNATIRK